MTDLLDDHVRDALRVFLDAAPTADLADAVAPDPNAISTYEVGPWSDGSRARSRVAIAVVGVLVVGACVGAYALTGRDQPTSSFVTTPPSIESSASTTPTTMPTDTTTPATDLPPTAPTRLQWEAAAYPTSIARSQVWGLNGVVAGPTGFVAVGIGFEDGRNVGRVWFSADGSSWQEPALDVFDAWSVAQVTATSTAFYVTAAPNPDRSEGDPAPPARIFRSADGIAWTDIGLAPGNAQLRAVGNVLLSIGNTTSTVTNSSVEPDLTSAPRPSSAVLTSTDGINWQQATTDADLASPPMVGNSLVNSDHAWYLDVFDPADVTRSWHVATTTDGTSWTRVTDPPFGGPLIGLPGGVIIASNDLPTCQNTPISTPADTAAVEASIEAAWACVGDTKFAYLAEGSDVWVEIEPAGIPPSMFVQQTARVGTNIYMPVTTSDGHLLVVQSNDEATTWSQVDDTTIDLRPDGAALVGPSFANVATRDGTIVIMIDSPVATGMGTAILVGHT